MVVHANTKLNPKQRKILAIEYFTDGRTKKYLQDKYSLSYPTVNKILIRAKYGDHSVHKSINKRYRTVTYGLRRLDKIELKIQNKLRKDSMRYEKLYPGEMVHFDTKMLPLLQGEHKQMPREQMFVAIDDYSRELYADIMPDKSALSSSSFLESVIAACPYIIVKAYSDNGTEYKGRRDQHLFALTCGNNNISQGFTKPYTPQTNGKAERVIRILLEEWHRVTIFSSREHRKQALQRYVHQYNFMRRHGGIDNYTPNERLLEYFYNESPKLSKDARKAEKSRYKS
jgi:transposase InsO family protein